MTEKEYITATDVARISSARAILSSVIPSSSLVIIPEEFRKMLTYLAVLENEHYDFISLKHKTT